jgi:hypothetical protein
MECFHTNIMFIKKFWNQGLLSKGTGFANLHVFKLLVLATESFMQINQVNSHFVPRQKIIMRVNELCSVTSGKN